MATCVCAGDLRERIVIEQVATTRDAVGGQVETWSNLATLWARVQPTSASERFYRQATNAAAGWKISIRYRTDITTKMRIVWGSRRFEIRGVQNIDEQKRFLELAADEIIAP